MISSALPCVSRYRSGVITVLSAVAGDTAVTRRIRVTPGSALAAAATGSAVAVSAGCTGAGVAAGVAVAYGRGRVIRPKRQAERCGSADVSGATDDCVTDTTARCGSLDTDRAVLFRN